MIVLSLLAAMQAGSWTVAPVAPYVGDTVVITRRVPAPPRATVRAEPLTATDQVLPLTPPQVIPQANGALVRYRVALFRTGPVMIRLPAVHLTHPETGADVLPGDSVVVRVASVLPSRAPPDSLEPSASVAPLVRPWRRPLLVAVPTVAVVLLILSWALWRRRRRKGGPSGSVRAPEATEPIGRWIGAGETRVSAAWGMARLRQVVQVHVPDAHASLDRHSWRAVIGVHRPDWPLRKLDEVCDRLDRARFAPLGGADVAELLVEVEEIVAVIERGPAAPAELAEARVGEDAP